MPDNSITVYSENGTMTFDSVKDVFIQLPTQHIRIVLDNDFVYMITDNANLKAENNTIEISVPVTRK